MEKIFLVNKHHQFNENSKIVYKMALNRFPFDCKLNFKAQNKKKILKGAKNNFKNFITYVQNQR